MPLADFKQIYLACHFSKYAEDLVFYAQKFVRNLSVIVCGRTVPLLQVFKNNS